MNAMSGGGEVVTLPLFPTILGIMDEDGEMSRWQVGGCHNHKWGGGPC